MPCPKRSRGKSTGRRRPAEQGVGLRDRPRNPSPEASPVEVWPAFLKTVRHFFPQFVSSLRRVRDPRDPRFTVYPLEYALAAGLMLFATKLGSRRQMRFQFQVPTFIRNLNFFCGTSCDTMLHPDTLAVLARRLALGDVEDLRSTLIYTLIRKRSLDHARLLNRWYLVAIDMTGQLVFHRRHCPHCLTQKHEGSTVYFHPVLEAKLVTPGGLALSMATEFVENPGSTFDKQDCEHKAFQRLAERLKRDFPQLPLCLLLDGLYACGPVFETCRAKDWRYITSFKEGSAPAVFREYEALKAAGSQPHTVAEEDLRRTYWWVNGVDFSGHAVNVLECRETRAGAEPTRFVWATDLPVHERNHEELANRGGRVRWKIENQGFNIQKTNGYELQHAYSEDERAMKVFYLLLQIAHLISQLMEKGLLAKRLPKEIGSLRNIARLLLEELRCVEPDVPRLQQGLARRIQIRFPDSS